MSISDITLADFIKNVFIPSNPKIRGEITKSNYRLLAAKFGRHIGREPRLADLTSENTVAFIKACAKAGNSRSTILLERQRLCAVMRCAFKNGHTSKLPEVGTEFIPAEKHKAAKPDLVRKPLKDGKAALPLINFFETHLAKARSPKTCSNIRGTLNRFGRWLGWIATVDELTESKVSEFIETLPKSIRRNYLGNLLLIWRELYAQERIETAPPVKKSTATAEPKQRSMTIFNLTDRFIKSSNFGPEQTYKARQFVNILAYAADGECCREVLTSATMAKIETLTSDADAAMQGIEMFKALLEYAKTLGAVGEGLNEVALSRNSLVVGDAPAAVDFSSVNPDFRHMELAAFYNGYYLPANPNTSPRTLDLYDYSIRKFSTYLRRAALLADLNNQTVGAYLFGLAQSKIAKASCNKERAQLLSQWRHAHTLGMITVGPLIKKLNEPLKVPTALTEDQLKRLRKATGSLKGRTAGIANSKFMRALMGIQYTTAARVGAVLMLRFDDFVGQVITFRAETRKGGKLPIVKHVPLWVLDDIDAISRPKRERVFPIAETNATKIQLLYDRMFKRADIPRPKNKSSHLLRSTHATHLWLAGGNASESLGHSSPSITQRHYLDTRFKPDMSHLKLPDLDG